MRTPHQLLHMCFSAADVDECSDAEACGEHAVCTNTVGSFGCACPAGFSGDGSVDCIGESRTKCLDWKLGTLFSFSMYQPQYPWIINM